MLDRNRLVLELLPNLRGAPARILPLQSDNRRLDRGREAVGLPIRPPTAVGEGFEAAGLVPVVDFVARLARDPELGAERGHLLSLEQARDKAQALVHELTLLPRHAPSFA